MSGESPAARARRKFAFGVIEQASNILGAMTASVIVVGLLLPAIATLGGQGTVDRASFGHAARLVLGFAALSSMGALLLRGLARRLEDDHHSASGGDDLGGD